MAGSTCEVRRCLLRPDTRARDRGRPARHVCQPDAVQRLEPAVRRAAQPLPRLALEGRQQRQRHRRRPARHGHRPRRADAERPGDHRDPGGLCPPRGGRARRPAQRALRDQQRDAEHRGRPGPGSTTCSPSSSGTTRCGGGFRHPVGLTAAAAWIGDEAGINDRLAGSDADWFSPDRLDLSERPAAGLRRQGQHRGHRPPLGHRRAERGLGVADLHPRPQPALHGLAPRPGPRRALRAVRRRQPARADGGGGGGGARRHPADPRRFRRWSTCAG